MKQYKRKKPKREVIIHPWIAEDSFIYSQTCAKLIYNAGETTVRFNGREERIDGRAVLISKKKTASTLLAACCKNAEIHESYAKKLLNHFELKDAIELPENSLLCGDRHTDGNMCHAALDHLCRAWLSTKTNLKIQNYIFYDTTWGWAKELIESLLPKNAIQYISPLQPVKCEKLFFLANSWAGGSLDAPFNRSAMVGTQLKHPACNANREFLRIIRRRSLKLIAPSEKVEPKADKIFVSRKSKSRQLSNQKEVEALFGRYGFKTIYFEDLTTSQQRSSMANARFVAGFHGAGLTNLIACRPGTAVLELSGDRCTAAYAKMAHGLGLRYSHENIATNSDETPKACLKKTEHALQKMLKLN